MTHIEFSEYHNRHIQFEYLNDQNFYETLSGVVLDILKYDEKRIDTEYIFIQSNNLISWKEAYERGDQETQNELQKRVDIARILTAQQLNPTH